MTLAVLCTVHMSFLLAVIIIITASILCFWLWCKVAVLLSGNAASSLAHMAVYRKPCLLNSSCGIDCLLLQHRASTAICTPVRSAKCWLGQNMCHAP